MPTQVSLLDGALASAGTLAIQTNGTTSAITISSAQVATFVNNPIMTGLTASRAVFTDGSKGLTSNAITGTGNVVMSASPTLTGTIDGAALTLSSSLTLSGGTANGVLYLNGSKVATSGSALTFDGSYLNLSRGSSGTLLNLTDAVAQTFRVATTASTVNLDSASGGSLAFLIGSSEQMRLTSTGLGIGTSSVTSGAKLDVNGQIVAQNGSTSSLGFAFRSATSSGMYLYDDGVGANVVLQANANNNQLYLQRTGNVGIGTSSPQKKLVVSNGGAVGMEWSPTDYTGNMRQLVYNRSISAYVALRTEASQHEWYIGGSESMRLDAAGNLGLGVTPSAWNSDYKATQMGRTASFFGRVNSNQTGLAENAYRDSGGSWRYLTNGTAESYEVDSGAHRWYTAPSGTAGNAITFTQAMTLDASGNLLLGNTSAIYNNTNRTALNVNGTSEALISLSRGNSTSTAGYLFHQSGEFRIFQVENSPMIFGTNNAERARITSGGYFCVGSATDTRNIFAGADTSLPILTVRATASSGVLYGINANFNGQAPNNTTSFFLQCNDTGAERATIRSNGGIANYQANDANLSDRREKTNFAPAGEYLSKICAIPVQTFNYIDQNMEEDAGLTLGVVAQDVQAVAPELVMESNWGTEENPKMRLSIYQTDLQYALMKCIQEQQAIIEQLKADVAALKGA